MDIFAILDGVDEVGPSPDERYLLVRLLTDHGGVAKLPLPKAEALELGLDPSRVKTARQKIKLTIEVVPDFEAPDPQAPVTRRRR